MNAQVLQLGEALDHIGSALASCGQAHWAGWLHGDAERLRCGDLSGISHFLSAFGGMGSLNDISLPFDSSIQGDISEAYDLAKTLERQFEL